MIKDFVLSSDYPIDQVIYRSDTIPVPVNAHDYNDITIPNTYGSAFLPIAQFSTSSDFSQNAFEVNASGFNNRGEYQYSSNVRVDNNLIYISTSNRTDAAVTFYFRIIGFALEPHRKASFTSHYHDMTFNTDNNQLKLYKAGTVLVNTNEEIRIVHNLGYKPLVLLWLEQNGQISSLSYASLELWANSGYNAFVDKTALTLSYREEFFNTVTKYHYRMYADE